MQDVTIIIPNYNGKRLLENCLKTLEKQTYKGFKVLVVDNGSKDGSVSVTSEVLDMEIVSLTENLGFCGAVNLGIQKTKTPYIILLNNDTEVDEQFVEALLNAIQRSKQIFSCGAQMIDFKNHEILDNAGDLYTALGWAVARGKGVQIMRRLSACFHVVPVQPFIVWMYYKGLVDWTSIILHIWKMWILDIVQGLLDMKTGMNQRQGYTMWGVQQQVRVIMKRKYFLQQGILFLSYIKICR